MAKIRTNAIDRDPRERGQPRALREIRQRREANADLRGASGGPIGAIAVRRGPPVHCAGGRGSIS